MVIEYAGTVIRAVLTDKRQKYYDSKVSNRDARIVSVVLNQLLNGPFTVAELDPQQKNKHLFDVEGSPLFLFPSGDRLLHVPHRRL